MYVQKHQRVAREQVDFPIHLIQEDSKGMAYLALKGVQDFDMHISHPLTPYRAREWRIGHVGYALGPHVQDFVSGFFFPLSEGSEATEDLNLAVEHAAAHILRDRLRF